MAAGSARAGKKIGSYVVESTLGKGGMGEVYLAAHELLERKVALKRLLPPDDDKAAAHLEERFRREGRALAQLSHHGIVGVYDLFTWRGDFYMALELIDGMDLAELLKKGALPIDVAALIGLRVAEALEHAHFHDIVHRDVKPANIMISRTGDVKLMDFGVARDDNLDSVTKTGMLVGTPAYLAPEVIRGEPADEKNDIYALGATLYYMLAGRRLFAHATPENVYHLIATGSFPRLASVARGVPRPLRRIVGKCLEKNPKRRYPSAAALRHELERFLGTHCAWANGNERLVAFLAASGHMSEEQARTLIDTVDFPITVEAELVFPWKRRVASAAALSVVVGSLAAWAVTSPSSCAGAGSLFGDLPGGVEQAAPGAPADEGEPVEEPAYQRTNAQRTNAPKAPRGKTR